MQSKKDRPLEALRKIILHEDELKLQQLEKELTALKEQIANKESLISSLDPIITDLLERKISYSKQEMAEALAPIMGDAIRHQIAEAKDDVVDALYPIIGKTIRKSVAEAMKKLVETVNQKIDQALRRSLFKKRIQSKITGVFTGELVLKDAMPFQIEQIFLIHKESGLLLSHVSSEQAGVTISQDLISAMLTAIRDFVSEAFKTDKDQELDEIQYGDSKILLEMGHYSYLAIVITGIESNQFRDDFHRLSRQIHNRYYKPLRQFDGDITQFGEMPKLLDRFLQRYDTKQAVKKPKKSKPYLLYLLLIILLICLIISGINRVPRYLVNRKIQNKVMAKIEAIPKLNNQNVKYRLSNGRLTISGTVNSVQQKEKVDSLVHTIEEIRSVDNRLKIRDLDAFSREVISQIRQQMSQSVNLRYLNPNFIVEDDQVIIEGKVPSLKTKRDLGYLVSEISGVNIVINNLEIHKKNEFSIESAKKFLSDYIIYFDVDSATIPDKENEKLDAIFNYVRGLENIKLVIKGYSDNLAEADYNLQLSEQRARSISDYLTAKGFPDQNVIVEFYGEENAIASNETEEGRAKNRRVEFDIVYPE